MQELVNTTENNVHEMPKRGSKRKALTLDQNFIIQGAMLEPLDIQDLVLSCDKGKAHFQRLRYFGCPTLTSLGELDPSKDYINMRRDEFVRSMYHLFRPNFNITRKSNFELLTAYIRWLDEKQYSPIDGDYFHNLLIDAYMTHWGELVAGGAPKHSWSRAKHGISFVLKQLNRTADARKLPSIRGVKKEARKTQGLNIDAELKPLIRAYFRAFSGFERHMKDGGNLTVHPIWDEDLFNKQALLQGWSLQEKAWKKNSFRYSVCAGVANASEHTWINQFSRIAAMIIFMFTGQNTSPILKLRHSDVSFDAYQAGKVYLNMEKARAKYLSFDTSIGFSYLARQFIESWLELSRDIQKNSATDWLFPYIMSDGTIRGFLENGRGSPQENINKLTSNLGLAHATPRILRQTKIDTLMRVTEDIFLVSLSANNEVQTLKINYSHGLTQDHERNLSASTAALFYIAKGKEIEEAVSEAKYRHHDVLSEYDYQRLRKGKHNPYESQTPLGIRCQNNTEGAAKSIRKSLKKSGIEVDENESLCTDFLACFDCPHHKLVAAVEDIWLMLSFRDTLTEMEQYPSVNSLPRERYHNLCQTIDHILVRFKGVSNENYTQALENQKLAPHPLYASIYSLNDLLAIFS